MIMGKVTATGTEIISQETVHGQAVNREQQAVFLIKDVANSDFTTAHGKPFGEPISVGQYILWNMSATMSVRQESDTQKNCS